MHAVYFFYNKNRVIVANNYEARIVQRYPNKIVPHHPKTFSRFVAHSKRFWVLQKRRETLI